MTPALVREPLILRHADESGPLAGPVGDGEDGAAMGGEAGEDVVGELPNRFGHDEGGVGVDFFEDLHAVLLAFYEAVSFVGDGVGALDGEAFGCDGGGELGFHVMLDGPAGEVVTRRRSPLEMSWMGVESFISFDGSC